MSAVEQESSERHELRRVMGPGLLLLFIIGDILGAGIYAVTGTMAGYVGGLLWLPFLLAFVVAALTALSYLELVTSYPQAAGAALYTHKAFGIHFLTFMVTFAVACSGITSASTSANTLAQNFFGGLEVNGWIDGDVGTGGVTALAIGFMVLLALINLRGVGESVKFNVVLTLVEITALCIVVGIGLWVIAQGEADMAELADFSDYQDMGAVFAVTAATSVAFFAMVGFEDSVNMVEETKDPLRIFPRTMLIGLGIAAVLYILVAISVVSVLTRSELEVVNQSEGQALLEVVSKGAPDFPIDKVFPFLAVFAVANTALINMLMASRLIYGMAKQRVLPRHLAAVLPRRRSPWAGIVFSTVLAILLIAWVASDPDSSVVANLSSVTSFLLLCVFTIVNIACMVLRGRRGDSGEGPHFTSPGSLPILAALLCLYLAGPWVDREPIVYEIAGGLLGVGIVLWVVTFVVNRYTNTDEIPHFADVEHMGVDPHEDER